MLLTKKWREYGLPRYGMWGAVGVGSKAKEAKQKKGGANQKDLD